MVAYSTYSIARTPSSFVSQPSFVKIFKRYEADSNDCNCFVLNDFRTLIAITT